MKKFTKVLLVSFLVLFAVLPINNVIGELYVTDNEITVIIDITNAYYTALDDDGIENDVVANFDMTVFKNDRKYSNDRMKFDLYVELILPSGINYIYGYRVTCKRCVSVSPIIYLYNHATEPGWYTIVLTCVLADRGLVTGIGSEYLVFDPPGGTPGTEPGSCMIII